MKKEKYMEILKSDYEDWKVKKLKEGGYFTIFNDFKRKGLKEISGPSLKLYIYLGIHSGNYTGESWHSVSTIAKFFEVSERTIHNRLKELEELGLIKRVKGAPMEVTRTYLLPY